MTEESKAHAVEVIGPFMPSCRLTSFGYEIPWLEAYRHDDGTFDLSLDRRFGLHRTVTQEELDLWLPFLAHAMAIAAGYSSHGENSNSVNPFKHRISRLSTRPNLTIVPPKEPTNG